MTRHQLERAAVHAHRHGDTWQDYWTRHADDVRALEPWDRAAYHRLVRRLTALVAAGDDLPKPFTDSWPRPEPWELADLTTPPGR